MLRIKAIPHDIYIEILQEIKYLTGRVEQYQYDQAGNRALKKYGTAENFKTGSYLEEYYSYDNRNRLLERNNPQNVTYYQYDNQGNTVSELTKRYLKQGSIKTQEGSTTTVITSMAQTEVEQYKTYEYDSFNKTARVVVEDYPSQNKEGHSITTGREVKAGKMVHIQRNFYDAENLCYGIEEDGERTDFVTNGWSIFTELDVEWNPTKRLVRGYGITVSEECGQAVEESITTELPVLDQYHFYHQNEHGDTEYITGSNGKVTNAYTYDAFGIIANSRELVKNRYTYNGEPYDQISQQYYLRARNYNPLVGRFMQEDVYRGDGLNLYAYCGSNPVMYVDPSGYEEKCQIGSEGSTSSGAKPNSGQGFSDKGYNPKSGERTTTREQWKNNSRNNRLNQPSAQDEVLKLPQFSGKTKSDIDKIMAGRGYTSVSSFDGSGTVWTKPFPDGNTVGVRTDKAKVRTPPLGYSDEVSHAHKETVPTNKVNNGNYRKNVTRYDDYGVPTVNIVDAHIPIII